MRIPRRLTRRQLGSIELEGKSIDEVIKSIMEIKNKYPSDSIILQSKGYECCNYEAISEDVEPLEEYEKRILEYEKRKLKNAEERFEKEKVLYESLKKKYDK